MKKSSTGELITKWDDLSREDIVIGEGPTAGIIKAVSWDDVFGCTYAIPGGKTTRVRNYAIKVARRINYLLCKSL